MNNMPTDFSSFSTAELLLHACFIPSNIRSFVLVLVLTCAKIGVDPRSSTIQSQKIQMDSLQMHNQKIECGRFVQLYVQFRMIISNSHHLPLWPKYPSSRKKEEMYAATTFGIPNNNRKRHTKCHGIANDAEKGGG